LDGVTDGIDQALVFQNNSFVSEPKGHTWNDTPLSSSPDQAVLFFNSPLSLENRVGTQQDQSQRFIKDPTIQIITERIVARGKTVIEAYGSTGFTKPEKMLAQISDIDVMGTAPFMDAKVGKHSTKTPQFAAYGSIRIGGDLRSLLQYLVLGSILHVGKAATYGYGGYKVLVPNANIATVGTHHHRSFNQEFTELIL
jgi:hypothetical protein